MNVQVNPYIKSKQDEANTVLATRSSPQDWRAKRAQIARDWLMVNGLAGRRDHFWSYTDPAGLRGEIGALSVELPDLDAKKILPTKGFAGDGVSFKPLDEAEISHYGDIIARSHEKGARPFAELALVEGHGAVLEVSGDGGVLLIDHDDWQNAYLRVNLAENAKLILIETITKSAQNAIVIEVDAKSGSQFDHVRIAPALEDRIHAQIFADMGEKADFRSFNLTAPSQFRRFETIINLNGDEGHVSIAGANLLTKPSFHDDTVYVTHNALNCTSRQVFKRVVKSGAKSVFQGKIYVKEGAQKTDGYQISQGLMLDDGGEVLSKPELEIYADDVACSHGSTTSGLDENSLFYLRSRGVPLDMAEQLLVRAFIEEAFEELRDEGLREKLSTLAEAWIFG